MKKYILFLFLVPIVTFGQTVTAGAIAANQTICSGSTPATLTSTTDGTTTSGTLSYQWQTNASGSYVTISGETASTYSPPALTATTKYKRITVADNGGTLTYSGYTIPVVVTVTANAVLSAIVTPNVAQTFCQGSSGNQLNVAVTGVGTFTRQWGRRSVSGGVITYLSPTGTNFTPTVGNLGIGAWFVVCTITPTCGSATVSNEVPVTINPTPTLTGASQAAPVCEGSVATINLTGMLPNTTSTVAYQLAGTPQPDITGLVSDAFGNASLSIVATSSLNFKILSITTTSTTPNCITSIGAGASFPLSVPTITSGSIGTAQTICGGTAPAPLTSTLDGTGLGTISYEWQSDDGTGYVNISAAITSTYAPPTLTTTTSYKRRTLSTFGGITCYSGYTTPITITVNILTAGVTGGAATICSGNDRTISQLAPGTATTGVIGRTYEWQANDGTGWDTIPLAIDDNYPTPILTITTSYRRRTVAISGGTTCYSNYATPVTITVNSVDKGKIGTKQSICAGDKPAPLTSVTSGTGVGAITYEWQSRVLPAIFTDILGAIGPTYSPGVTTVQTSYRRRAISTLNGLTCVSEFDALTIKVNEPEEGIIGTDQTICSGTTPATLTSIEDGQAPGTITYEWQANDGAGYVTIPSAILSTYTPPGLTVTTSYQRRTTGQCAGLPTYSVWTTAVTITVNAVTAGTIGTTQTYCNAATPAILTSTLAGTGAGTITYEWQTNASGFYVTIPGATAPTYSPPLLTATTSYQRKTISTLNGVFCNSVYTTPITITIDSNPVAPTITAFANATCIPFTGTVTLSGLPATGTWTINPGGVTGTGTSTTITGLSSGTYTFTVTNSNGCVSIASSAAAVASAVTNTWNGTTWSNGTPNNQQSLIFSGNYPSTIDPNVDLYGCSCTVTTGNNVTIKVGRSLFIADQVTVVGTGTLTFENTASLVQVNNVTNSGNINYIRTTTPINKFDYTYWSTPVLPFDLGGISPNTNGEKYYSFDSSLKNWKQESITTSMVPGKGYIVRGPQSFNDTARSAYVAVFNGVPINGTVSISGIVPNAPYLLGNPYPSALDADSFLNTNQNVLEGTLYFWTHNTPIAVGTPNPGTGYFAYSGDDYATYNQTGGTAVAPSSNTGGFNINIPSGKIATCQGFFGRTKTVAAGFASSTPILYTNAMRVGVGGISGDNTQFFRTKGTTTTSATLVEKHRVWLNLTNEQGAFKQTLVGYVTGATNAYESRFDGKSIDGNEFLDFYSINQDMNLTIQGRTLPFDENDEVILGYRCAINGDFTINIDQVDGLLTNQSVFIEDKLTNSITDLKASNYSFKTTKGTFNDRFVLRYKDKTLGTNDLLAESNVVLVSVKNKQIKINSFAETIDKVTIYDLLGRKIYQKDKVSNDELLVMNFVSSYQTLIVKTTLQNGRTVTNKIFIR